MSATQMNPFPGMNPYFEGEWPGVHAMMIVHCSSRLQSQLPAGLRARVETGLRIDAGRADEESRRPDASVWELREDGEPYQVTSVIAPPANAATPIHAMAAAPKRRRVTIRETSEGERLVTAIEFLSPSNKRGSGAISYQFKRDRLIDGGVNLVEVDLVRDGGLAATLFDNDAMVESMLRRCAKLPAHLVTVTRAPAPDEREFYPIGYQDALPSCAIPLREADKDIWLNLQELADRCFEDGGFYHTDYSKQPDPPLSAEDAEWLDELLKSKGLRSSTP